MFYCKISYLIVLVLSVVCFSSDRSGEETRRFEEARQAVFSEEEKRQAEEARQRGLSLCQDEMYNIFQYETSPIVCISIAITKMKLYGLNAFSYIDDVKMYYESFHWYMRYDKILLPTEYCSKVYRRPVQRNECESMLEIFQETPLHEIAASENFEPDEYQYLDNMLRYSAMLSGRTLAEQESPSRDQNVNKDTLRKNVMKNALYHHVIYPSGEIEIHNDAKPYFHKPGTYGHTYLNEIANNTRIKPNLGSLRGPMQFCMEKYM